jgi:hypothetical protein
MQGDPEIGADGPIRALDSRQILCGGLPHMHGMGSLARLSTGRLLLTFTRVPGNQRCNNGTLMISRSDDDGFNWERAEILDACPEWDCVNMGGLMTFLNDCVVLAHGRLKIDPRLSGDEPCTDWCLATKMSEDHGCTWGRSNTDIQLFPEWTELYGASNPHQLSDGRCMLAAIGTSGRDVGWQAGVTFTSDSGLTFTRPTVVAAKPGVGFGDMDIVRLTDGRFLAVARVFGGHNSVAAHSIDEGRTWSRPRPISFAGANIKLYRLRSGAVLSAYRDERGNRTGVACSVSDDGGDSWDRVGWLALPSATASAPLSFRSGYPDILGIGQRNLGCVLHPAPDMDGNVDLRWIDLVDRT